MVLVVACYVYLKTFTKSDIKSSGWFSHKKFVADKFSLVNVINYSLGFVNYEFSTIIGFMNI